MINRELLRELFIDIDYQTIIQNKDINNNIIKSKLKYIKNATKYIPLTKLYKLYKNITIVYEERKKDKYLEEIEYNIIIYFIYLLNTNIIKEEDKEILVNNIISLYDKKLTNEEITKEELKIYSYTEKSSKHIYDTKEKIKSLEKVGYSTKSMLGILEENISCIMKGFSNILDDDIRKINPKNKNKIKKIIDNQK